MYPMYRFMDSHPYQRNQVPYNPHYYPHFELNPHHMNIDPTRFSLAYEWPCGSNYGYPYPPQGHNCCIHNNSSNHCSFRPPYPYIPPPAYSNPAYPGMYPAYYVPPPHFTMEQPRYEYDKNMDSDHHCCGCSNHPCYKKGGSNVKIEEHDQDKKNEGNESLVPFGFKNSPFPVVWLPPDYMKNGERVRPIGSKGKEQEDDSQVLKPYGDIRCFEQPKDRNAWPPYHGNNSQSPNQSEDSTRKQQHDDVNMKQFPFPIIWMPYKPEEAEGKISKETDSGNIAKQQATPPSKSTVPRLHDAKVERSNSGENEVNSGSETSGKGLKKESVTKTIPVKQVEQNEKNLDEKREKASEMHYGNATEKKVTQDGEKRQSTSPKKSFKLPPVCLRVDPLPRKRSDNGNSRSPSPSGGKGKSVESYSQSSKPSNLSNEKKNIQLDKSLASGVPEKSIEVQQSKSKTKVVEVAQGTSKEDKPHQCTGFPDLKGLEKDQTGETDTTKAANEPKCQPDRVAAEVHSSNEGQQSGEVGEAAERKADAVDDMKKDKRRKLSNDRAATMIQSAYRGYNTRRWKPLDKLKQIAKIKEQMAELKTRVQALEKSAENGVDNKERTIITESIMGLLLKLDTIQGLHPNVRESRKSVAKELVSLQEKLDLMNCKKQPAESEQSSIAKSIETTCRTLDESVPLQGGEEVQKSEQDDDSVEVDEGLKFDAKEPCGEKPVCVTETLSNTHHVGNAEIPAGEEENKNNDMMENFSSGSAVETRNEASALPSELKEKADDKLFDENVVVVEKTEECDEAEQSLPNPIPFSGELTSCSGSEVQSCCGLKETGEDVNELEELPRGILDEDTRTQESSESRKHEFLQYDKGDLTTHIPEVKVRDTERLEQHHLEALGETPVTVGPEIMNGSNRKDENSEVLETDAEVSVDVPEKEIREARPLNEGAKISVDKVDMGNNGNEVEQYNTASDVLSIRSQEEAISMDKVDMGNIGNEVEQYNTASDGLSIQSQEEAITMKQCTDTTEIEKSENVQNAVERDIKIPDSVKTIELAAEPLQSNVTNDKVDEYHVPDKQNVEEENMVVQGEDWRVHNGVVVSVPNNNGEHYNVEVDQKLMEETFELQGEQPVAADNTAPIAEEPVDRNRTLASPTCEAATTETELLGEKVLDVTEDHSFSSTPNAKEDKGWTKVDVLPSSPTASQVSFGSDAFSESDRKLIEENEKLREMMEKLIEAGKEQLTAISSLSGRVKDLEKRLSRKKKLKLKRNRPAGSACMKPSNNSLKDRAVGLAM